MAWDEVNNSTGQSTIVYFTKSKQNEKSEYIPIYNVSPIYQIQILLLFHPEWQSWQTEIETFLIKILYSLFLKKYTISQNVKSVSPE